MQHRDSKVIGYFGYHSRMQVACTDVDACVISGSRETMAEYLAKIDPGASNGTIRKTRFGEILRGMKLGAAYAFDEKSYARFYPLAQEAGIPVAPADFAEQGQRGARFFTVRPVR
jgi:hypothetical protein